jgi:PAS domain S-box-containing protein
VDLAVSPGADSAAEAARSVAEGQVAAGKSTIPAGKSMTRKKDAAIDGISSGQLDEILDLSPSCHAVFAGRRLVYANLPFRSVFIPPTSDTRKFTLKSLFGKGHGGIEKDLALLEEGSLPSRRYPLDIRLKLADGSEALFSVLASRLAWEGESAVALALTDVSERESATESLRADLRRAEGILMHQVAPVMLVREGMILKANQAMAELFGRSSASELSGRNPAEFVPQRYKAELTSYFGDASSGRRRKAPFECADTDARGVRRYLRLTIRSEETDQTAALVCSWEDITPLRSVADDGKRLAKERAILETLTRDVHQLHDTAAVVEMTLRATMKWLGFEAGGAYVREERSERLHLSFVDGLPKGLADPLEIQSDQEGVTGLVARTSDPLLLDVPAYPPHLPYGALFEKHGFKTALYLPLVADDRTEAILLLCSRKGPGDTASDIALLKSLVANAGEALAYVRRAEKLHQSESHYRRMVEEVNAVVYETSATGEFLYVGPHVTVLTGYSPEEALRIHDFWVSIVHPDDRAAFMERFSRSGPDAADGVVDYRLLPKGKAGYRTVRDLYHLRRNESGGVGGFIGMMMELKASSDSTAGVTEVNTAGPAATSSGELSQSEEMLRNVIDTMGDALLICDLEGKVWEVNREFTRLTGYPRQDVIGQEFPYPWLVENEASRFLLWLGELREKEFLRDFDMTWRRPDGGTVAISLNTTFLRNSFGEPIAMLNIGRDISERVQLSNQLTATSRQVETLNRVLSKANSTMELPQIFDVMAEEILALITFDHLAVCMLRPWRNAVVVSATWGNETVVPPAGSDLQLKGSLAAPAIAVEKGVVIEDILTHPELGPESAAAKAGMRSALSIPIIVKERVLGALTVARGTPHAYIGDELNVLQPIADQIGALVERTTLFDRVKADSAYIHNLLNSIDSAVFTVDRDLTVLAVNAAWHEFALAQGTPEWSNESEIPGRALVDIIALPSLREEIKEVVPRLLAGVMHEFSCEFDVGDVPGHKTYQLVVTPMTVEGVVTGLVFTTTDITNSKRTEAEVKRRNEELLALNAVASSIITSLNIDDILKVAGERIKELTSAGIVLCYLREPGLGVLALASSLGISEDDASRIRFMAPLGSVSGLVVAEKKPIIIPDGVSSNQLLAEAGRQLFGELGMRSLIALPIQTKERVLGTLVIVFPDRHEFVEQEERFLQLICNQLGSALENAKLYTEVQSQVQRTTLLYEIGQGLTGALDRKSIFSIVRDGLARAMKFDAFAFFEVAPGAVVNRLTESVEEGREIRADEEGVHLAARGQTYAGITADDASLIAVPVRAKGVVMGVLAVKGGDVDTVAHLRLVESIGTLTGITVDRALLYEDTVAKSEEIEQRNKELDDFTYVVSHDLKEPLITIEGYSKIVLDEYRDAFDSGAREYLSSVVNASQRMKNLIDDLLTLSRLGRVSEVHEGLPLGDIIHSILHDFEFTIREKHATVVVADHLPTVRYNRTRLGMVFRNLIANAIKFNRNENPRIEITAEESDDEYVIAVRDNGIGIGEEHYEKIFVVFQRLHRSDEFPGTGAGLTIVKRIIESHHGRIWVDSKLGEGTTFKFTIPR